MSATFNVLYPFIRETLRFVQ